MSEVSLWAYSAISGSLATLAAGLLSLLVPDRTWGLATWVILTIVFTTAAGLLAPSFVEAGDER